MLYVPARNPIFPPFEAAVTSEAHYAAKPGGIIDILKYPLRPAKRGVKRHITRPMMVKWLSLQEARHGSR